MLIDYKTACEYLKRGEVVAIPTETVYGLAASLSCSEAIDQIYTIKKRPADNPLIIHVADSSQVEHFAKDIPQGFSILANTW